MVRIILEQIVCNFDALVIYFFIVQTLEINIDYFFCLGMRGDLQAFLGIVSFRERRILL